MRRRQRRDANLEDERARCRAWRERNIERKREMDRQYYAEHAEKVQARVVAWRLENPERHNAWNREWYQRHLELNRARSRQQAIRRRSLTGTLDEDTVVFADVLRGDPCAYCGRPMEDVDHIVPVVRGGDSDWMNLTAACGHCNKSKSTQPLLTYLSRVS